MRRLELDFARRPRTNPWGIVLLVLGCMAAWAAYESQRAALDAIARAEDSAARLQRGSRRPAASAANAGEEKVARDMLASLDTPWEKLFLALESAGPGAALIAVEPDARTRRVKLTLESKTIPDMLSWVARLRHGTLADATLTHHAVQTEAPGSPVRFTVQAGWSS